ncbi:DUF502 domain-containing protein [Acidimangrovimonas sediminis]|uniref:DUF502 domain-containing protein n=1 Tax=Acidimangrovimonas sediminis TaxID=2056283 RepID=UPI000C7FE3E6|nr:DUF502 domain-containing protein [Acidimangrovimonas sediminis]
MTEHDEHHPKKRRRFGRLRNSFLTGLVVVLPIGLTLYLIWTVTGWIDSWVLPFIPRRFQPGSLLGDWLGPQFAINIRGVGVIIFLVFTVIVGWLAKGIIGRSMLGWGERMVDRMPVVRSIYAGLKQIAETVFAQTESNFDKACLVEYPRKGIWAIGFVSTNAKGEIAQRIPAEEAIVSVFLPTTPNPTSGFLLYLPASEVTLLDMKVEDAAKLIISAGLVYPNPKDPATPPAKAAR